MISRRVFISGIAGGLLSAPITTEAQRTPPPSVPSFTRGQWTQYGTGSYNSAVWRGDGKATSADGTAIPTGTTLGDHVQGSGGPEAAFNAWCGSPWDTTRSRLLVIAPSGHTDWPTNEINEFDFVTGTWNPDGRPIDPTTELWAKNGVNWPPNIAYGPRVDGPPAFVDVNGHYPNGSLNGLYPNCMHTAQSQVFIPPINKILIWIGGTFWNPFATMPFYWNIATKKYEALTNSRDWGATGYQGYAKMAWDSVQQRVVFHDYVRMWKFDHAAPAGSRVTPIGAPDAGSLGSADYSTHVFDPKRNRSIMFGGNMNGAYYSYVAKPNSTVRQTAAFSGNTSMLGGPSPGVIYDPVRDVYVLWRGGRSLTVINPDTFVCTVYTPTAGATPTIPRQASQSNAGVWHRFAYLPAYDVYATVSHAADVGAFVYMPKSTALVYDP